MMVTNYQFLRKKSNFEKKKRSQKHQEKNKSCALSIALFF